MLWRFIIIGCFFSVAASALEIHDQEIAAAEARIRRLPFVGSDLRNGYDPFHLVVGIFEAQDISSRLVNLTRCVGETCRWGHELGSLLFEFLAREYALAFHQKEFVKPGFPILLSQAEYDAPARFLFQLYLYDRFRASGVEEEQSMSQKQIQLLFESYRATSRLVQGLSLAPAGSVVSRRLIREMISASPSRSRLRDVLETLSRHPNHETLSLLEQRELAETRRLIETETEAVRPATALASEILIYGVCLGQIYLFVPLWVGQAMHRFAATWLKGSVASPLTLATQLLEKPLFYLENSAHDLDLVIEATNQRFRADMNRRYPETARPLRRPRFYKRFRRDFERRFGKPVRSLASDCAMLLQS